MLCLFTITNNIETLHSLAVLRANAHTQRFEGAQTMYIDILDEKYVQFLNKVCILAFYSDTFKPK